MRSAFLEMLFEKVMTTLNVEVLDEETTRMVERMVVLRIATKRINLWIRQLEMKRREILELAGLMMLDEVKNDVETEKSLECWARRCTNHFAKKVRRMLYEETDNMMRSGNQKEIAAWCKKNKVYDEITEEEIEEIWQREVSDDDEPVRLNGKYVWKTAKRICDFINTRQDLVHITSFGEYRIVMLRVMRVIKEANNAEQKRRKTSRMKKSEGVKERTQRAKALIAMVKRGEVRKDEVERRIDEIFGNRRGCEIEKATTTERIVERIEELSKREAQLEEWERMRQEAKKRQREDRRLNTFWRKNKTFPCSLEETTKPPSQRKLWPSGGQSTTRR